MRTTNEMLDTAEAAAVFADPVTYLAGFGIAAGIEEPALAEAA